MHEDRHYRDTIETYHLEDEDEYFLIVEGDEPDTYDLDHKTSRFGYAETIQEGMQHVKDVQQVLVGMFEELGREDKVDEVLTPNQ